MAAKTPSRPAPPRSGRTRPAASPGPARRPGVRLIAVVVAALVVLGGVALLAFTSGKSGGSPAASGTYNTSKTAFDLPTLEGTGHVRLADHAGKPVVVNFFASWCIYCNEELPGFVNVAKATKGKVDFIGVNTAETGDGAAMAKRFDLTGAGFELARDLGSAPASALFDNIGGRGLPITAFYDRAGKLRYVSGGMLTQPQLEQEISKQFGVTVQAANAQDQVQPVIPINPQGAAELMNTRAADPAFVVLDVRTPAEFAAGHLPNAINLDVSAPDFAQKLRGMDKAKSYLVYCQTGNRSGKATDEMHAAGFEHLYDLQGGVSAWQQLGGPLTK